MNSDVFAELSALREMEKEYQKLKTSISQYSASAEIIRLQDKIKELEADNQALEWWKDSIMHELGGIRRYLPDLVCTKLDGALRLMEKRHA